MRSPHTMVLEIARPGIGVFHATLIDLATSQIVGVAPCPTPPAAAPRNAGQFSACAPAPKRTSETVSASARVLIWVSQRSLARLLWESNRTGTNARVRV